MGVRLGKIWLDTPYVVPEEIIHINERKKWAKGVLIGLIRHLKEIDLENVIIESTDPIRGEIWFFYKENPGVYSDEGIKGWIFGIFRATLPKEVEIRRIAIEE